MASLKITWPRLIDILTSRGATFRVRNPSEEGSSLKRPGLIGIRDELGERRVRAQSV